MRQTSSYRLAGNVSVSTAESLLDIRSEKDFGGAAGVVKHGRCAAERELFLASLYVVWFFSHAVRISRCLDESGRGFRRQRFVSAKRICVSALQFCVYEETNTRGKGVCVYVSVSARVTYFRERFGEWTERIWRVIDLSTGLLSGPLWTSRAGVRPEVSSSSSNQNGAFICVYRSCRLSGIGFAVKGYSTAGWLSTTPCELWSKISSHNALQRACTFIGTHIHTLTLTHTYTALGPIADPHTLQAKKCLIRWT